jgi:hypothetical protein
MSRDQYFATLPADELADACVEKTKRYYKYLQDSGIKETVDKAENYYYGNHGGGDSTDIVTLGDDGEIMALTVNDFRVLIRHTHGLITSQKPSYDPRAKNTDFKTLQETRLATNIIDSYMSDKRIGRHMATCAERSLVAAKAHVYMRFNTSLGKPYGIKVVKDQNGQPMLDEQGQPIERIVHEGDIEAMALSRLDVIYNHRLRDRTQKKWVIIKTWENRWDEMERYPQIADDIESLSGQDEIQDAIFSSARRKDEDQDEDLIPVYEFYHVKTDTLPNGRYFKYYNSKSWAYDGPMPYRRLPEFSMSPSEKFDTLDGHTDAHEILRSPRRIEHCSLNPIHKPTSAWHSVHSLA